MSAFNGVTGPNSNSIFGLVTGMNSLSLNSDQPMSQAPESPRTPVQQRTSQAFARMREERKEDAAPKTPERAARAQIVPKAPRLQRYPMYGAALGQLAPARVNFGSAPASMAPMEIDPPSLASTPSVTRLAEVGQELFPMND